jgi:type I restriction enzyme, R subunit
MKDDTELFKQFSDNPEFKRWLADTISSETYDRPALPASDGAYGAGSQGD